jgi:hypothetical protein
VDYGEYLSHYAHCSGSPVLSGRRVSQGEVVAYSGNTGGATSGPHVHWEVMRNGWNLQNSTYGRIDPRTITGSTIAAQGDTTPEPSEEDDDMAISPEQMYELKRFIQDDNERRHTVTRNFVTNELAKKIDDSAYSVKVFTQKTDNENTDRAIIDNREVEAGK